MRINRLTRILPWIFILYTLHITLYTSIALCASKGNPPVAYWRFDEGGAGTTYEDTNYTSPTALAKRLSSSFWISLDTFPNRLRITEWCRVRSLFSLNTELFFRAVFEKSGCADSSRKSVGTSFVLPGTDEINANKISLPCGSGEIISAGRTLREERSVNGNDTNTISPRFKAMANLLSRHLSDYKYLPQDYSRNQMPCLFQQAWQCPLKIILHPKWQYGPLYAQEDRFFSEALNIHFHKLLQLAGPYSFTSMIKSTILGYKCQVGDCFARLRSLAMTVDNWLCPSVYAASKGNPPVAYWRFDEGGGPTAYEDLCRKTDFFQGDFMKGILIAAKSLTRIQNLYASKFPFRVIVSSNSFSEVFGGNCSLFKSNVEGVDLGVVGDSHISSFLHGINISWVVANVKGVIKRSLSAATPTERLWIAGESLLDSTRKRAPRERPFGRCPIGAESALSGAVQGVAQFIARIDDWLCPSAYAASKGNPPVAHWRFDEAGGGTAYDDTANNNDGTLNAGAGGANTAVGQMWTRQGKIGAALECDGTDDYISVSDTNSLDLSNWTISFWVKFNSTAGNQRLISKNGVGTSGNYYLWRNDGNTLLYYGYGNGTAQYENSFNPGFVIGNWHSVVFTYNGTTQTIFIDGVQRSTFGSTAAPYISAGALEIGFSTVSGGNYTSGLLDDVRIYNYARTADQILVDYNAGAAAYLGAGTDPNEGNPPVGYWKFDENTGTTAYDRSGNGNNGTLTNMESTDWIAGKYGSALQFDGGGSNEYISLSKINSLEGASNYTIAAWIKTTVAQNGGVVGQFDPGNHIIAIHIGSDGIASFITYEGGYSNVSSNTAVNSGQWRYIAIVKSGTTGKIYIDGIEKNSGTVANVTLTTEIRIGTRESGAYPFNGLIDDVKIYNYARTQAQIAYDYSRGAPVAQYKFDEGGGTIAHNEYSLPSVAPHRYWRFVQTAILNQHAPRTCELRLTDLLGNIRTPDSYTHGGTFQDESLWNASFDGLTNTTDQGWISGNTGYIDADFGTSGCAMMKFEAYGSYTGSARGATWDIQYSDDNSNWVTVKTWNFQTTDNGGGLGVGNYAGWYGTTWHTHGTLVGDTKFVDGKIGKALTFDGTGDYVDCGTDSSLDLSTGSATIEAWFKTSVNGALVTKRSNSGFQVYVWGDKFYADGAGTAGVYSINNVNNGAWHHGTAVYDRGGSLLRLYVDGKADNTVALGGTTLTDIANLNIGRKLLSGAGDYFNGLIDDVRIYNYARTADQILQDYNAGVAGRLGSQAAGVADPWAGALPVGYWKLDENTGVLANDASGNGKNGTITGAIWAQGKNGSGVKLTTNDTISINNFSQTFTTGLSIFGWVKTTSTQTGWSTYRILQHWNPGFIMTYVGGNLRVFLWDDAEDSLSGSQAFNDGNWHYIGFTVNISNGIAIIYVDGKEDTRKTSTITTPIVMNGTVTFNNGIDNITVDDFKIYNYARTTAQIAWDYNKGKPVGYWRFDEASGATCYDDSGNNNGTATIGATGTQTTIASARTNGATGKYGKCMSFDGTDDYVGAATLAGIPQGNDAYTISAWIKPNAMGVEGIVGWGTWGTTNAVNAFRLTGDGLVNYWWSNDLTITTGSLVGAWHHVIALFDGTTRKIYVDGILKGSDTPTGHNAVLSNFRIGSTNNGEYFNGLIDDVRIYNYARTTEQILQDYNQGLASKLGE